MRVHTGVYASSEGVVVRSQGESCKQHASLIPKLFIFPPVGRAKVCMMQKASAIIILNFSGCTKKTALSKTCKQSSTPSGKGVYIRVASIIPHRDVFLTGELAPVADVLSEDSTRQDHGEEYEACNMFEVYDQFLNLFTSGLLQGNVQYLQRQNVF